MDSIPLLFEFNLKTYIPVVNNTNKPVKLSEHKLLFDKICKYLYLYYFINITSILKHDIVYNLIYLNIT